jgi:hypothetical protein
LRHAHLRIHSRFSYFNLHWTNGLFESSTV